MNPGDLGRIADYGTFADIPANQKCLPVLHGDDFALQITGMYFKSAASAGANALHPSLPESEEVPQ